MYAHHFGLRVEAFSLTPDPAFLYLSPDHEEALAALKVGLEGRRGLIAMVGEVGTGKTTLLYSLLSEIGAGIRTAYISNTRLSFDGILRQALADFGVACEAHDRVDLLNALNGFLRQCAADGATAALVIDEAQNLEDDAFENLRLLSNFETYTEKLLQIVLVGQPELETKLRKASLRQVAERIAVRCYINPLSRAESLRYVDFRLRCAGGSPTLFTPGALRLVGRKSRGVPRRINIICHNALLFAYGRGATRVTRPLIRAAVRAKEGGRLVTLRGWAGLAAWESAATDVAIRPRWVAAGALGAAAGIAMALSWGDGSSQLVSYPEVTNRTASDAAGGAESVLAIGTRDDGAPVTQAQLRSTTMSGPAQIAAIEPPVAMRPSEPGRQDFIPDDAPHAAKAEQRPPDFREINIPRGTSLMALAREFYGQSGPEVLDRIKSANPKIIDVNRILAGDTLRLPQLDGLVAGSERATHE